MNWVGVSCTPTGVLVQVYFPFSPFRPVGDDYIINNQLRAVESDIVEILGSLFPFCILRYIVGIDIPVNKESYHNASNRIGLHHRQYHDFLKIFILSRLCISDRI